MPSWPSWPSWLGLADILWPDSKWLCKSRYTPRKLYSGQCPRRPSLPSWPSWPSRPSWPSWLGLADILWSDSNWASVNCIHASKTVLRGVQMRSFGATSHKRSLVAQASLGVIWMKKKKTNRRELEITPDNQVFWNSKHFFLSIILFAVKFDCAHCATIC